MQLCTSFSIFCYFQTYIIYKEFCHPGYNTMQSMESQPAFQSSMSPQSSGEEQTKQVTSMLHAGYLKMTLTCSLETSVNSNGLHSIISQKIDLFVTTAVRTSSPALCNTSLPIFFQIKETICYSQWSVIFCMNFI